MDSTEDKSEIGLVSRARTDRVTPASYLGATLMEKKHQKYQRLIDRCKQLPPTPTAVAHPGDEASLKRAIEAVELELGLLMPIILASRADAVMTQPASCVVAALVAKARRDSRSKAGG